MKDNSKYNILIVDDDKDIREMIALLMSKTGYNYASACDGDEALSLCSKKSFDVVLLDIMMPNMDGYAFCNELRKSNQLCFIIFITALDTKDALEKALLMGGDDFLSKPFEPRELLARIKSCLRRVDGHKKNNRNNRSIEIGDDITFMPDKNIITMNEKEIHFTPTESSLLYLLLSNPGKKFTYSELYEKVWETNYLNDKGTVATFVSTIKKKLKDGSVGVDIATIWGEGYFYKE